MLRRCILGTSLALCLASPSWAQPTKTTVIVLDSLGLPRPGVRLEYVNTKGVPEALGTTNTYGMAVVDFKLSAKGSLLVHWDVGAPLLMPLKERLSYPTLSDLGEVIFLDFTYPIEPDDYYRRLETHPVARTPLQEPVSINKGSITRQMVAEVAKKGVIKEGGTVVVKVSVDKRGYVVGKELTESPNPIFAEVALQFIDQLRFIPAIVEGQPAASTVNFPITFHPTQEK